MKKFGVALLIIALSRQSSYGQIGKKGECTPQCPVVHAQIPPEIHHYCTGQVATICIKVQQSPGCCHNQPIYYPIEPSDWSWWVDGVNVSPQQGQGSCAVFTNLGPGRGYVNFSLSVRRQWCGMDCEASPSRTVEFYSHDLQLELSKEYLGLDLRGVPCARVDELTASASTEPAWPEEPYRWSLGGTCRFKISPTKDSERVIIVETCRPSAGYRGEKVTVAKGCLEKAAQFTVVKVDLVAPELSEEQEAEHIVAVSLNDNDSDESDVMDKDEEPLNRPDPDLVPIRLTVAPRDLPEDQRVELSGYEHCYEDPFKRVKASSYYFVGSVVSGLVLYVEGKEVGNFVLLARHPESEACDELKVGVFQVDLDVDSDNTGQIEGSWEEEKLEDKQEAVGKVIAVNRNDEDRDGIPNFADGYDLFGSAGTGEGGSFTLLKLTIGGPVSPGAEVIFAYPGSDPAQVQKTERADGHIQYQPAAGQIRIWRKDGCEARNKADLRQGGDYIQPGARYGVRELMGDGSEVTLYVEGIKASQEAGDVVIQVTMDPDGPGPMRPLRDEVRLTVIDPRLVVDWNHDRKIEEWEAEEAYHTRPYRFWINDDNDEGDIAKGDSDVPGIHGSAADSWNERMDGRSDAVDFFPVWLELSDVWESCWDDGEVRVVLKHADEAVRVIYSGLSADVAGAYLVEDRQEYGDGLDQNAWDARAHRVTAAGLEVAPEFLVRSAVEPNCGLVLLEGRKESTEPLVAEIWWKDSLLCRRELPLSLSTVEKMYRWINLRGAVGGTETRATDLSEPPNNPDVLNDGKSLVFVHGYSVSEASARGWNAEIFKRLYWSGSKAKYYGVTWWGNESERTIPILGTLTPNYHVNVVHAFETAPHLAEIVMEKLDGEIIIAAHSLGNMVVSSAIQHHGLTVSKYFMINAAVAIEAYDGNPSLQNSNMWYTSWDAYEQWLWCSEWHTHFTNGDGRRLLTWRNIFSNVAYVAYNFYSSGEDVFRTHPHETMPGWWCYVSGEYAWALQEKRKGASWIPSMGGSTYGGWGFNSYYWDEEAGAYVPPTETNVILSRPFFNPGGNALRDLYVPTEPGQTDRGSEFAVRNRYWLLAGFVPALTLPVGGNQITKWASTRNYNMQNDASSLSTEGFQTGWPATRLGDPDWENRWLHNDFCVVAYRYVRRLYDKFSELGGLRP